MPPRSLATQRPFVRVPRISNSGGIDMADRRDTLNRFAKAVCELIAEADITYANPGEGAITGRLVELMKPHFPDWTVVGQWDRREQDVKELHYAGSKKAALLRKIVPDIIVHHAGTEENLLVVEAKRHVNTDYADDIGKLEGMTAPDGAYHYDIGAHLILNIPERRVVDCNVYVNGAIDADLTAWIRPLLL